MIANRGEIAARIAQTLRSMGIKSVAVASEADRFTRPVLDADEAVVIGGAAAAESYLLIDAILDACRKTGAEAVHPGYGFLSENARFAQALNDAGVAFIGPRPEHLSLFGLKHTARDLARRCEVPLLPGTGLVESVEEALAGAARIGFPVMLKSVAGGGGIGMSRCDDAAMLQDRFGAVKRAAEVSFGDGRLYLERFIVAARHIEVQIFGNGKGKVVALGERDCSLQRRNQKVIEETPAPDLPDHVRAGLADAAVRLAASVNYESAGTVEFIYDAARREFYFLEVNTRLQVEHPVTEKVFDVDLVEWMVRQAAGEDVLASAAALRPHGAAVEARVYAENPNANFRPAAGLLTEVVFPEAARVDSWVETGTEVTPYYDPLLAKIIVHGATREEAVTRLRTALDETRLSGIETNLAYLRAIAASPMFENARVSTAALSSMTFSPRSMDVIAPGAQSTIQELPGRLGLWDVGVPPSGPMDSRSFRIANRIAGNPEGAAALEMTARGPVLRFNHDAILALTGARMGATLDSEAVPNDTAISVKAGQTLTLSKIDGPGLRTYLAIRGGFSAPVFLGSRAAFTMGQFGGHSTGALKAGDVLHFENSHDGYPAIPAEKTPELTHDWKLSVLYGPHGCPDFFTGAGIETLFSSEYEVHFNSARTGVRLIGPKPQWARLDGGEAGLHPSNLHDNAYAIGSINFTGDMPILLGPDGPSLGGFVCPAVVTSEDLWKLGQLKPGDKVRFEPVERLADPVAGPRLSLMNGASAGSAVVGSANGNGGIPVIYRRSGDDNLLVEYGPMTLDIGLRLRVHLLMTALAEMLLPEIIDLTPGIRTLQVHYDGERLSRSRLIDILKDIEGSLPNAENLEIPSRIVHLPLSWEDVQVQVAIDKYQELVRRDAPWCPSNLEFIRRINGLETLEDVRKTVFDASYLVLGLGDVYLGAPVATPLDPRHRLITTKYNPARTWTPENAVGIGGAYLCIYGLEGPGGYQLVGRTIQIWNSWRKISAFQDGKPWLLRFFDQIRFYPVSPEELDTARAAFPHGAYPIDIQETTFSYRAYKDFLAGHEPSIAAFRQRQRAAFDAERERWTGLKEDNEILESSAPSGAVADGMLEVTSEVSGNVWKVVCSEGDSVDANDTLVVIESMKMEISISAGHSGTLTSLRVKPGQVIRAGDTIAVIDAHAMP